MYSGYIVLTVCLGLAEIVRLLKSKGIHMQSGDSSTSAEEATKRRRGFSSFLAGIVVVPQFVAADLLEVVV